MANQGLQDIAQNGLNPKINNPQKIIIIGAGMAGLTAAYELQRAGHHVTILEAQERVGGRILTLREPFSDGLYGEVGAMRIPRTHKLTMHYIEKFGLETMPFHITMENNFFQLNGKRYPSVAVNQAPSILDLDVIGPDGESSLEKWGNFVAEAATQMRENTDSFWKEYIAKYDNFSVYDFFKDFLWSETAVEAFAVLSTLEPVMHISFLTALQVSIAWQSPEIHQIVGGMDHLPKAFLSNLEDKIIFGAEVIALDYTNDSATVHYKQQSHVKQISGDYSIITMPFSALRFVDVLKPFSTGKQQAIRRLRYTPILKVLLQFENRFWEIDDGLRGGNTTTDLPNRQIYYPERRHMGNRGVVIGTYTYGAEASRWAALPESDRVQQCLKYVSQVHPQAAGQFETGISKYWGEDKWATGMATYYPGEFKHLFPHTQTSEGAVHFAGEHTSYKNHWIEGAVESGLRAASEIHEKCS